MAVNATQVGQGFSNAKKRFPHGFETGSVDSKDFEAMVIRILNSWPKEPKSRFVELFAELAGISNIAHLHFHNREVAEHEILGFLGHCITFFNSFSHLES